MTCWDCGKRRGIHPAVDDHVSGIVGLLCQLCLNRWRRYLKGGGPKDGTFVAVVN
jgi:hypothetical protein